MRLPPATPVAQRAALVLEPLDLSPQGELRLLVRVRYSDEAGRPALIAAGGNVDVLADRGSVQAQPRARFGGPAAIVRLTGAGPLHLRVTSDVPRLPHLLRASTDTRAWRLPVVTARALGPHAVWIGWFPRVARGTIAIERRASDGSVATRFTVAAPASMYRDTAVRPNARYTYEIRRPGTDPIDVGVTVPPELIASSLDLLRGKAVWLAPEDIGSRNVDTMLGRAAAAELRAIQLRLTYGEYAQITAERKATIDRFIDGAAARRIAVIGWTVPRALNFEDLAANVAAAAYRTPAGNGVSGLSVDLERGADFLGDDARGAVLGRYIARLREAVGPHVLLAATVEDPYLERLPDDAVPYAAIALSADVLQPMTYWRMRAAGASPAGMCREMTAAFGMLRRLAGRTVPIDVGGQTVDLGNRYGAPPAAEVAASFGCARSLGAIGEALYAWNGTSEAQWMAIGRTPWPLPAPRPRRSMSVRCPRRTPSRAGRPGGKAPSCRSRPRSSPG